MSFPDLSSFSHYELGVLIQKAQEEQVRQEQKAREEQERPREIRIILHDYGSWFCSTVSAETICKLPKVKAESLDIHIGNKYVQGKVRPAMLGTHAAVRGIMGWMRPFIAIKVEVTDISTNEVIGIFVEVIYKRYGLNGDGCPGGLHEHNYVTALANTSDDGKTINSCLYNTGGMKVQDLDVVRDLLAGKAVETPTGYKLKMVVEKSAV